MSNTTLKVRYEKVCNDYLKRFCKKQGFYFEDAYWIANDIGSVVSVGDYFFNMHDIVWDINSNQKPGIILDWYNDNLKNINNTINYYSYTKGLRIKDIKQD